LIRRIRESVLLGEPLNQGGNIILIGFEPFIEERVAFSRLIEPRGAAARAT
jgi:hypothetical protein